MRITFDPEVDASYIELEPDRGGKIARTVELHLPDDIVGQIFVDFDHAGTLLGIEVLDASHLLPDHALRQAERPG